MDVKLIGTESPKISDEVVVETSTWIFVVQKILPMEVKLRVFLAAKLVKVLLDSENKHPVKYLNWKQVAQELELVLMLVLVLVWVRGRAQVQVVD